MKRVLLFLLSFTFISTIYSILLILITIYELNTIDFLKKIGNDDYITLNYSVIVLKNSEYKKIEDIENKKIAIASDLEDNSVSKIKGKKQITDSE